MLNCIDSSIRQLKETLEKIDGFYDKSDIDKAIDGEYLRTKIEDKEKFTDFINTAIKNLQDAQSCVETIRGDMSFLSPYYSPLKKVEWVSKEEFYESCGNLLESENVSFELYVKRYTYGEVNICSDNTKYGLYIQN